MVASTSTAVTLLLASSHCDAFSLLPLPNPAVLIEPTISADSSVNRGQPQRTSRRRLLQFAAATSVAAPASAAYADPSFVSSIQGPVQDVIAPGHWIGQLIGINSKTETWAFSESSPAQVSVALVDVISELSALRRSKLLIPEFKVSRADSSKVHILTWTKAEWLDAFDVSLEPRQGGGCVATASFYATGFFPTSIPLAPAANVLVFWLPFGSPGPRGEMLQSFRLRAIKGLVDKKLQAR